MLHASLNRLSTSKLGPSMDGIQSYHTYHQWPACPQQFPFTKDWTYWNRDPRVSHPSIDYLIYLIATSLNTFGFTCKYYIIMGFVSCLIAKEVMAVGVQHFCGWGAHDRVILCCRQLYNYFLNLRIHFQLDFFYWSFSQKENKCFYNSKMYLILRSHLAFPHFPS